MTDNVVEIKKRSIEQVNQDLQQMYTDAGFISFRMACDSQMLQQKYQKISELNKEATDIQGETNGSNQTK